jgi:hypothetical protein
MKQSKGDGVIPSAFCKYLNFSLISLLEVIAKPFFV